MVMSVADALKLKSFKEEQVEIQDKNDRSELEKWIAGKIGTAIQKQYPRMRWGVLADTAGQYVLIICPVISQTKGYYLHLHRYTMHELEIRAVQVAGEILERHGVSRHQLLSTDNVEAMPRDLRQNIIATDSAPVPINKCH